MRRALLIIVGLSAFFTPLQGQRALIRLERAQETEVACALVNDDGTYRLEKMFRTKNEIYKGTIEPDRLNQLLRLLGKETLAKLSQTDIHSPLITDTIDNLQIAIHRARGWQELTFLSPTSRRPYRDSVEPLLRWFQDLQKQKPSASRLDSPQSRCMPSADTRTDLVVSSDTPPKAVPSGESRYLFRIASGHFYNGHIESSCTLVRRDGSFHHENGGQSYGADRHDKVVEGKIGPSALQELRAILDRQELKDTPASAETEPQWAIEGDWAFLQIPREDKLQNLAFETTFNTLNSPKEAGGGSNLNYRIADKHLLEPLTHWMKANTQAGAQVAGAGNNCAAN